MCRVILLFLIWTGLSCPAAAAPGAEAPSSSAPSPVVPSCFVFIQVSSSGELTILERLKGFGPSVERPLSSGAKIYGSLAPFVQESDMELVSVKADGKPVTPSVYVNEQDNNRYVRLAARDTSLPVHEYTLTYKARERILFLSDVDRLDWDIWGKRFDKGPIWLSCAIALPQGATVSRQWSRLGHETIGHRPVTQWINKDGVAFFRGEEPMADTEHFVVSVEWNKGVVASDGSEETLSIVKSSLWGLFALLLLLCGGLWFKFGKDPRPRVSIPLFYPPLGPDGKTLSPAAVAYIRDAAMLTSRGFSALLLNLATQKMVDMTGTGSRKDPYVLRTSSEIMQRVPMQMSDLENGETSREGGESTQHKRRIWENLLKLGRGFDLAECLCIRKLFPTRPPQPLEVGRKSAWKVAVARSAAYEALASQYRDLWHMNRALVSLMFILCYGGAILMQTFLWLNYAADIDAVLAITCLTLGLTYLVHRWATYGISIWVRWQEMGIINMILLGIYVLHLPVMLVYDAILGYTSSHVMDGSMSDFFLFPFMERTRTIRSFLWLGLMGYFIWLTRDIKAVFLIPLKILGFLLIFFVVGGMIFWANSFMGSGNLAFMGMLFLPMFFMPLMKRPAPNAAKILAEIEGLALYLGTAEAARLNIFNPPDRSPEEFHRFLPYAVALGLEKAWGAQFATSLADLQFRGGSLHMMAQYEHRMQGR